MEYDKHPIIENIGNYIQWMLPLAALICTLLGSFGLNYVILWFINTIVIVLLTGGFKRIGNYTPYGKRPNGGDNTLISGHTSATMGASFFMFHLNIYAGLIFLPFAIYTAFSRIYALKHHLRDVLAGTGLSLVTTLLLFHYLPFLQCFSWLLSL